MMKLLALEFTTTEPGRRLPVNVTVFFPAALVSLNVTESNLKNF